MPSDVSVSKGGTAQMLVFIFYGNMGKLELTVGGYICVQRLAFISALKPLV